MPSVAEKLLTADEFVALAEDPRGGKMELVEGRVVAMSPVGEEHADVAAAVYDHLAAFVRRHRLGKVGFELGFVLRSDPDTVRGPDVLFVSHDRLPPGRDRRKFVRGAPNLAVEVVSPQEREDDLLRKVGEYLQAGSERVWVVRPKLRAVTVYRTDGNVTTVSAAAALTSDDAAFPVQGFELPVASLFDAPDA